MGRNRCIHSEGESLSGGGSGGLSPPAPGPGVNSSNVRNGCIPSVRFLKFLLDVQSEEADVVFEAAAYASLGPVISCQALLLAQGMF